MGKREEAGQDAMVPGRLEAVDDDPGIYRIPFDEAPEPFGVNIVRLVADQGAGEMVVEFTGLHDPDLHSGWRARIVAVHKDAKCRYSPTWNKGKMTMDREERDVYYWLTVAAIVATPFAALRDVPPIR